MPRNGRRRTAPGLRVRLALPGRAHEALTALSQLHAFRPNPRAAGNAAARDGLLDQARAGMNRRQLYRPPRVLKSSPRAAGSAVTRAA